MNFKKIIFLLVFLSLQNINAQNTEYLLALSKGDKKVLIYDYKTLDSITSIDVGDDPHEIVTNKKGDYAYVSHPVLRGKGHTISVINLKDFALEDTIDTAPFYTPHGLVYKDDKLWVTAQGSKSVVKYNLQSRKAENVFGTGQDFTHLIYLTKKGNCFYTTNVESGTLSIYENKEIPPYMPPTGVLPPNAKSRIEWRQTLIDVGLGAEGFDVNDREDILWTARPDGYIVVVDLLKKEVKTTINTGVQGLHRLKFTPDGKYVAIVSVKTGDLLFYNAETYSLEKKINIGRGAGIYMDTATNRMFVSCTPEDYIVVMDLKTRKEIKRLKISRPDGVTSVKVAN